MRSSSIKASLEPRRINGSRLEDKFHAGLSELLE